METRQKLKIELPYDPAIPLLGIYPEEIKSLSRRDICTWKFTAVLLIITKTWKQPKCPLIDGVIMKMWYVYIMEYYSTIKKGGLVICNDVNGSGGHYTKWNKIKTNTACSDLYVKSKKLNSKKQNRFTTARGWDGGGDEVMLVKEYKFPIKVMEI